MDDLELRKQKLREIGEQVTFLGQAGQCGGLRGLLVSNG